MAAKPKVKSKFSNSIIKGWKTTDVRDVENILGNKQFAKTGEKLQGSICEKIDKELCIKMKDKRKSCVDTTKPKLVSLVGQHREALNSLASMAILVNSCNVPDPIKKRNFLTDKTRLLIDRAAVTKLVRKHRTIAKRAISLGLPSKHNLRKKVAKVKKEQKSLYNPNNNIWDDDNKDKQHSEWLEKDVVKHYASHTGQLRVKVPSELYRKPSVLAPLESPLAGTSYRPASQDHQQLLNAVIDRETAMLKAEKRRSKLKKKLAVRVDARKHKKLVRREMASGLFEGKDSDDGDSDYGEYKALNPPALNKRKTLQKKKRKVQLRREAVEREMIRKEKKKLASIYKLRMMQAEIVKTEEKWAKAEEIRRNIKKEKFTKTNRLGPVKYIEPLLEFKKKHEIEKSLRCLTPAGSILVDRYNSLQKRNLIEPKARRPQGPDRIIRKKTVKKRGHRECDVEDEYEKFVKTGQTKTDESTKKGKRRKNKLNKMLTLLR